MKLATWDDDGNVVSGVFEEDGLHRFPDGLGVIDLVRGDHSLLAEAVAYAETSRVTAPEDVRMLPPLLPTTIRDFATFEEHVEGMTLGAGQSEVIPEWYESPVFYFSNPYAVTGPFDDIPLPPGSSVFDYELEVGAVIGRDGFNLSPAASRDHIFGYTIMNDWSARDLQSTEMKVGLGPAKGKDTATTIGPYLVTADELERYRNSDGLLELELRVAVNGTQLGNDLLSNMSWTFEEITSFASRGTWVRSGDLLGSGTAGNGGCLAELWARHGAQAHAPLAAGDVVEISVEGIGTVRNRIVEGVEAFALPPARSRNRERRRQVR